MINEENKQLDYIEAHKFSSNNEKQLKKDEVCGCFYCLRVYNPEQIDGWLEDKDGKTAVCPHCGIDSVVGESSGFPITSKFLKGMHDYWF